MAIGHWYDHAGFYQPRYIVYLACVAFAAVALSLFLRRGQKPTPQDADIIISAIAIPIED